MDRERVLATPREHEAELKTAGIVRLSLFGSVARDEAKPESDVDLIAAFDATRRSLPDRVRLENRLADLLGAKVDLAPAPMLKADIRERAAREAVLAF